LCSSRAIGFLRLVFCLNQWQPGDVSGGSNVKIQFTSGEQFCSDASGQQPHDGVCFLMSDVEMRPTWFSKSSVSLMIRAFLRQPQRRSLERARQTLGRSLQGLIECPSSHGNAETLFGVGWQR